MLQFYAERFSTTEINYTFYRIPNGKTMGSWDSATPEYFRFGLKAPQKVTHISKLKNCEEYMGIFQRVVSGLGSKLGPVLFQLPPTFKKDAALLNDFLDTLSGEPKANSDEEGLRVRKKKTASPQRKARASGKTRSPLSGNSFQSRGAHHFCKIGR